MKRFQLCFLTVGIGMLHAGNVAAYCRTTTCDREDAPAATCGSVPPGMCNPQGTPIAWPDTCVSTSVSAQGSALRGISADAMRAIVSEAFQKWTTATCPNGGHPRFSVDMFPDVNCTEATGDNGYRVSGPNYNLWIFEDSAWPYNSVGENAIAITTTQFNPSTGEIYDSDVELNAKDNQFTMGDDHVIIDLPSVVLHEAGHFLGIAHSNLGAAVMSPTLDPGDLSHRALGSDDIHGICAVYPPGELNPACNPEPRHGFSTECTQQGVSCAIQRRRAPSSDGFLSLLCVGVALGVGITRRRVRVA